MDLQILIIQMLQSLSPSLDAPMRLFSFLGQPEFYLLLIPFFYWCRDPRLGFRLGILLGLSGGVNDVLKTVFHMPRPYWVSPEVAALNSYPSFGLPSAHAQGAVTFWGYLAANIRRRWFSLFAAVLVILIGVSRIYEGVHYPMDTVAGWLVGLAVLAVFLRLEDPVGLRLARLTVPRQVLLAFAASLVLLAFSGLALAALGDWQVPEAWKAGALERSGEPIDPLFPRDSIVAAGLLFGFAAGGAAQARTGSMCAVERRPGPLLARYAVGIGVTGVIWYVFGLAIPGGESLAAYVLIYLRAATAAAWVSFGAPELFTRMNLAGSVHDETR
ncbi:phosphoesterase PA-phosphatase [Methanoculleus taiwanensis]|uniref:Phosphoesterase PA-phosphatase n=1 Tax=Methanoculleus taiwanensis TaxID=1550565 RepID=A0A498H2A0_9EURY|nr:phosphatase PAP2 family protein [Methanoculleus taiwanensis]RXE57161.1 phosphoesterase PA-phosphatase [Methanoculleus taiwanensis]